MRKHDHGLFIRLNEADNARLRLTADRSHLPVSTVIRKWINGDPIAEYPPADYWNLLRAADSCRNALNSKCLPDPRCRNCPECRQALAECTAAWRAVFDAFFNQRRAEQSQNREHEKEQGQEAAEQKAGEAIYAEDCSDIPTIP